VDGSTILINLAIGVMGSITASLVFLAAACFNASRTRRSKAKPFVGKYRMLNVATRNPYGGTVSIERADRISITSHVSLLDVTAEHENGTEDWTAVVEVLGYSRIATGYFTYRKLHDGGQIRLLASEDAQTIEEYATPHSSNPFSLLLDRIEKSSLAVS
jgi:hypothetical protein